MEGEFTLSNTSPQWTPKKTTINPLIKGGIGSFISLSLLITAYTAQYLSWLSWVAFVPLLITLRGKRKQIYFSTSIMVLGYHIFLLYYAKIFRVPSMFMTIVAVLIITTLISEVLLFSSRFSRYWWLVAPIIWTFVLLIIGKVSPQMAEQIKASYIIMPFSQGIFQLTSGTYGQYLLIFIILLSNTFLAEALYTYNRKKKGIAAVAIISVALICGFVGGPITDFPKSTPEAQGMDSKVLEEMNEMIPSMYPEITSVLVLRNGYTVFEKYYNQCTKYTYHNIFSATKSIMGSLVGIALEENYIQNLDQKVIDFFPELDTSTLDSKVKEITIRHLLTMTSGFEWEELYNKQALGLLLQNENPIKAALSLPIVDEPGKIYNYNSPGCHVLSGIINRASDMEGSQFADRKLFGPLGIYTKLWSTDSQRNVNGGTMMLLRTRDMAKFGYMYLRNGSWEGKQILTDEWVKEATKAHNDGGLPGIEKYGYLFWVANVEGHDAFFAYGAHGQYIYVIPDLDLVIVTTAIVANYESIRKIVPDYIIPSVIK